LAPTCTVGLELFQDRELRAIDDGTIDDAADHFVLHAVPAGSHVLTAYCGDRTLQRRIEVRAGARTELKVTIEQFDRPGIETIKLAR
jgi:hypothetical protein